MSPELRQEPGAKPNGPQLPKVPEGLKSLCGSGSERLERNGDAILGAGTVVLDIAVIAALPNPPFLIGAGVAIALFGLGMAARAPAIKVLDRIKEDPPDPNFGKPAGLRSAEFRFSLGIGAGQGEVEAVFSEALGQFSDCGIQLDRLIRSFERVQGAIHEQHVSTNPERVTQLTHERESEFIENLRETEKALRDFSVSVQEYVVPWLGDIDDLIASNRGRLAGEGFDLDLHAERRIRAALLSSTIPKRVSIDGLDQASPSGTVSLRDSFVDVSWVYSELAEGLREWGQEYEVVPSNR